MTLDPTSPLSEHQREVEHWTELAARTEAEDRARWRLELEDRDACESTEAMDTHWAGVMAAMPQHVRDIHYESGPG